MPLTFAPLLIVVPGILLLPIEVRRKAVAAACFSFPAFLGSADILMRIFVWKQ